MPIMFGTKRVKCLKCGKKFTVGLGDVRPQISKCPYCGCPNLVMK